MQSKKIYKYYLNNWTIKKEDISFLIDELDNKEKNAFFKTVLQMPNNHNIVLFALEQTQYLQNNNSFNELEKAFILENVFKYLKNNFQYFNHNTIKFLDTKESLNENFLNINNYIDDLNKNILNFGKKSQEQRLFLENLEKQKLQIELDKQELEKKKLQEELQKKELEFKNQILIQQKQREETLKNQQQLIEENKKFEQEQIENKKLLDSLNFKKKIAYEQLETLFAKNHVYLKDLPIEIQKGFNKIFDKKEKTYQNNIEILNNDIGNLNLKIQELQKTIKNLENDKEILKNEISIISFSKNLTEEKLESLKSDFKSKFEQYLTNITNDSNILNKSKEKNADFESIIQLLIKTQFNKIIQINNECIYLDRNDIEKLFLPLAQEDKTKLFNKIISDPINKNLVLYALENDKFIDEKVKKNSITNVLLFLNNDFTYIYPEFNSNNLSINLYSMDQKNLLLYEKALQLKPIIDKLETETKNHYLEYFNAIVGFYEKYKNKNVIDESIKKIENIISGKLKYLISSLEEQYNLYENDEFKKIEQLKENLIVEKNIFDLCADCKNINSQIIEIIKNNNFNYITSIDDYFNFIDELEKVKLNHSTLNTTKKQTFFALVDLKQNIENEILEKQEKNESHLNIKNKII